MQPWASGPGHGRKELKLSIVASLFSFFSVSGSLGQELKRAAFGGGWGGVGCLCSFGFSAFYGRG